MQYKREKPSFIHLHVRSDYSMIDGLSKVHSLIKKTIDLQIPALAITDFTNVCGLIKFYSYAHNSGIKPIIGADFLINDTCISNRNFELTCLASNNKGYNNLITIISKAYRYKLNNQTIPTIKYEWLSQYNQGLILLSGGYQGDIGQHLIYNETSEFKKRLSFYMQHFHNRYYFEITRTNKQNEIIYLDKIIKIAAQNNIPLVATNNVRFINSTDFEAHQIRVAIYKGESYQITKKSKKYTSEQFMKNQDEMCKLFSDIPESLENTVEIAKRCNVIINLNKFFLPKFPSKKIPIEKYLIQCAKNGLKKRINTLFPNNIYAQQKIFKRYNDRLNFELTTINNMGFPGYFLIVMEFIQWAKKNNIPVGPGRGSGASSLVAYALKITDLDPLKFNLLFERFLNPKRISMPDLDIDFCMNKRDMVIDHVIKTYGEDSVSQIITFSTMTARAAIKDVGRALGYPYIFVDRISKLIPLEPGITLKTALNIEQKLKTSYNKHEDVKLLIDMACQLEGVIKNIGKHAGGIVIAPTKITDFSPLYYDKGGKYPMTQFDKDDIEHIGLVKFDFLGLRTLTIIDATIKIINKDYTNNKEQPININSIPLDDQKSFETLKTGETTAIFQLESKGMKELIKRLQPDCFEDIIALIALFRPGPLQSGMVDNFINRKHGREKIFYPDAQWQHKKLKPVLESTYGIILYQEQIMQIAQVLAGYTLDKADILCRAIGKKQEKEMTKQRSIFKKGAEKLGIDNQLSMKIFDLVEKFSGYGFNKAHSSAYALISYQTLWLKTHYPTEFMTATLNADIENIDKIIKLINECRRMSICIIPPNINISQYYFYINHKKEIVYGMGAIKGIGINTIESILKARKHHGKYHNLLSLCILNDLTKLNQRVIEKLILSGSCDCFGIHRLQLLESLKNTIQTAKQYIQHKNNHQLEMFKIPINQNLILKTKISKFSEQTLLEKERETIGMYLSQHPITQYLKEIKNYTNIFPNIQNINTILQKHNNKKTIIVGLLVSGKIIKNKYDNYIGICTLDDNTGQIDVIFPPKLIKIFKNYLHKQTLLFITGYTDINNSYHDLKIIAEKIEDINEIRKKYVKNLSILLSNEQINHNFFMQLYSVLEKYKNGTIPIYFYYKNKTNKEIILKKTWNVTLTDELLNNLRKLINDKQITINISTNK